MSNLTFDVKSEYINLLIKCLCDDIYKFDDISEERRLVGGKQYKYAFTMTGLKRMYNTYELIQNIISNNIAGDFVECGVWRGGQTILMNALVKIYNQNRNVYCFDSYCGLPKGDDKNKYDKNSKYYLLEDLKIDVNTVKNNFKKFNLLTDNVFFVEGFFKDTIPNYKKNAIALLRLDGDMYDSTMQCLDGLYKYVSKGGYVVIDDWTLIGAHQATIDFRKKYNINSKLIDIFTPHEMKAVNEKTSFSVYWQKED